MVEFVNTREKERPVSILQPTGRSTQLVCFLYTYLFPSTTLRPYFLFLFTVTSETSRVITLISKLSLYTSLPD